MYALPCPQHVSVINVNGYPVCAKHGLQNISISPEAKIILFGVFHSLFGTESAQLLVSNIINEVCPLNKFTWICDYC